MAAFRITAPSRRLTKYRVVVVGRCQSGGSHSTSPIQVGQHTRWGGCLPHLPDTRLCSDDSCRPTPSCILRNLHSCHQPRLLAKAPQPIERADGGVSIVSNTASWRFGFHTFKGGQSEKPSNNMAKKRPPSRDERQCADTVEFAYEMRNQTPHLDLETSGLGTLHGRTIRLDCVIRCG